MTKFNEDRQTIADQIDTAITDSFCEIFRLDSLLDYGIDAHENRSEMREAAFAILSDVGKILLLLSESEKQKEMSVEDRLKNLESQGI